MADSAVPDLFDALVAIAKGAFPDENVVMVYDGQGATDSPGDFLMVGVSDPDTTTPAIAANTTEDWVNLGADADLDETGAIDCCAMSWNGQSDQALARATAYTIRNQLAAAIRAQPMNLGIPQLLWTTFGTVSDLKQAATTAGARAVLHFRIYFRARI